MTWQENIDTNMNKIACNTQNQFTTCTLSAFETCFWHVSITCYFLKFPLQTHKSNPTCTSLCPHCYLEFKTNNSYFVINYRMSYIIALSMVLVPKEKLVYFMSSCCTLVHITILFLFKMFLPWQESHNVPAAWKLTNNLAFRYMNFNQTYINFGVIWKNPRGGVFAKTPFFQAKACQGQYCDWKRKI